MAQKCIQQSLLLGVLLALVVIIGCLLRINPCPLPLLWEWALRGVLKIISTPTNALDWRLLFVSMPRSEFIRWQQARIVLFEQGRFSPKLCRFGTFPGDGSVWLFLFVALIGWDRAEADMESGEMRRSDVAVSFLLDERDRTQPTQHTVGNLEVALTLRNASALFDSRPESTPVEKEKEPLFSVSFYKHLVVPRKIFLAVDPRYKLISNYIDLAFEIGLNPKRFVDAMPSNTPADSSVARVEDIPVDMRLGGSWQLNKNNLVKFKVDQHSFTYVLRFILARMKGVGESHEGWGV